MKEYQPLLIACGVIGLFTLVFVAAYFVLKHNVKHPESERHMSDGYLIRRLLHYAKPHIRQFVLVFVIMLVSLPMMFRRRCWSAGFRA